MKQIEVQCGSCNGTGLYAGMGERDGAYVICCKCKGTGKSFINYTPFVSKRPCPPNAKWVYATNPGILVDCNGAVQGGVSIESWETDNDSPKQIGKEMRSHTCPAWWYQSANYKLKPAWDECIGCGSFTSCKHFQMKSLCWERWDKENANK